MFRIDSQCEFDAILSWRIDTYFLHGFIQFRLGDGTFRHINHQAALVPQETYVHFLGVPIILSSHHDSVPVVKGAWASRYLHDYIFWLTSYALKKIADLLVFYT